MQNSILLETELNYRLGYSQLALDSHPESAIPRMRSIAWHGRSDVLFKHAWLLKQLQQPEQALAARQQTLAAAAHAFGYADTDEYYTRLMNCFKHALLSGNAQAASEWAVVLQKSQQPNPNEYYNYYLPFYRLLTSLWLGLPVDFALYQKAMDKVAALKSSHYPTGTVAVMKAIAASDTPAAALAIDEILVYHAKKAAKPSSFVYNDIGGFVYNTATLLCITALWRGLALKPLLTKHRDTLKLMPQDLPHRTELSPKCRFLLPVDYIPDELLAPWQQQRLVT
jgi:hypothetical protein